MASFKKTNIHVSKHEIEQMKLHDVIIIEGHANIGILRVINGWIYQWGESSPVFVPCVLDVHNC